MLDSTMWKFLFFSAVIPLFQSRAAELVTAPHVQVSWLAPKAFGQTEKLRVGIRFKLDPHWHIYWKNPGDSGSAPKFNFTSAEVETFLLSWPFPKRLPIAHLTNFGYENEVVFPVELILKPGQNQLHSELKLEWLVCQEECIPGFGTLSLSRPIDTVEKWNAKDLETLDHFVHLVPQKNLPESLRFSARWLPTHEMEVSFVGSSLSNPALFPLDKEAFLPKEPLLERSKNSFRIIVPVQGSFLLSDKSFPFVLVDQNSKAWDISVTPREGISESIGGGFFLILFSAFLGGMILNLMPCVLPVLAIKLLSLARLQTQYQLKEAFLYSAGVVLSFLFLGGLLLMLRASGLSIGWGFQLQSPSFVLLLILLFWLLALNLYGYFEIGSSLMGLAGRGHNWNAFGTGILSVFVAAPCTGPFIGAALGAAITLPSVLALSVFLFMGVGFASPFLLVVCFPVLARMIPRPGHWMLVFKQFLSFPLFATAVWLVWVLSNQIGNRAMLISGALLLTVSFCIWISHSGRLLKSKINWLGLAAMLLAVVAIALSWKFVAESSNASISHTNNQWKKFDSASVKEARAGKKAVFVDFTASWCITCQVNRSAVLETSAVQRIFQDSKTVLFEADWTQQNPEITSALAQFGRNSVPLYVFYPADGSPPHVLPQILTQSTIESLFQKKENIE